MRKIIQEGEDPFAEPPPVMKRVLKGLAVTAGVIVVALGGLAWFRFQPAFSSETKAAIKVEQPAWGTATVLAPRAPEAAPVAPAPVAAAVASEPPTKAQAKNRGKAKSQHAKARNQSSKMPPQVAKTPTGN